MGCGASAQPYQPNDPNPDPGPVNPPENEQKEEKKVETQVQVGDGTGEAITIAGDDVDDISGGDSPEDGGFRLPFVRFDKSKVPKELYGGDEVYLKLEPTGTYLQPEENAMNCLSDGTDPNFVFAIQRKDGEGKLMDGDAVLVKHVATGMFMQADSDSGPVKLAGRDPEQVSQVFTFFKLGHPLQARHKDTVFLQSWLTKYVELIKTEKDENVTFMGAKRWNRGPNTMFTILKKTVLDQPKTDTARKMQFQAFDLDGNGSISRAEMEYMLKLVTGSADLLAGVTGLDDGLDYEEFVAWADSGALTEDQLMHAEAIGNTAQRCNDALNEEKALIEVIAVPDLKAVMDMKRVYAERFPSQTDGKAGDLPADIEAKTGEQDGWGILSNYWKLVMRASMEDEVDLWCRCFKDCMDGWGTDEEALTYLVCTMPDRLRIDIFKRFHSKYGKGLLERVQSETSGKYKKVLECQMMAPEDTKAKLLYESMKGLGTDEDQLVRIICQLDIPERRQVKEAFQRMYKQDLIEWVKGDTSGNFQKSLLFMLNATEQPFDLEADCQAMYDAMKGWGTDEGKLVEMICGKTQRQMQLVNEKFQEMFDRDLFEFVKSETSGHFQAVMLGCIRHPMDQLAECVYRTMKGWGTSELGLITMLVHLPDFKKEALKKQYKKEFKKDLLKHIKSETSGDLQECLMNLVRPAPTVWAMVMYRAMKGWGTDEKALINTCCISKDDMGEVRKAFKVLTEQKSTLAKWLNGDTSGDFKRCLAGLANRNTEDDTTMAPIYWAQRGRDAVRNADTLKSILVALPSPAIKRGTEVYQVVYGAPLEKEIAKKTEESNASWFTMTDYYKKGLLKLLKGPVEQYSEALNGAMAGLGTDEYTLSALVCTMPSNQSDAILKLYKETYKKSLYDHIKSETSKSYQKALLYQVSTFAESRARAFNDALTGIWSNQDQVIRLMLITSAIERGNIDKAYHELFQKSISAHVQERTDEDSPYQICLVAMLEQVDWAQDKDLNDEEDCNKLNQALNGEEIDTDDLVRCLAKRSPDQIQRVQKQYEEMFSENLERQFKSKLEDDSWSGIFCENHFRNLILGLMRTPMQRLAFAVRDCIKGWGTDNTGLLTCLVHLSEKNKVDLIREYENIPFGGNIFEHIKGDCSGDFENILISLLEPAPKVMARALRATMKGPGTSDNLLINWMCLAKERMDEVRDEFAKLNDDGKTLADWIDGDCGSKDYKDLLMRLANREVYKYVGSEVAMTLPPPKKPDDGIYKFAKVFNEYCAKKKQKPSDQIKLPESAEQEMAGVFMYFASKSSAAPDLDMNGMFDLTTAVGFPPNEHEEDGVLITLQEDIKNTFMEWDVSGTGSITWNDFVREMTTRINDANHYEADPLPANPPPGLDDV